MYSTHVNFEVLFTVCSITACLQIVLYTAGSEGLLYINKNNNTYLSSESTLLYLALLFVLHLSAAIRKLHFCRQIGLKPG